MATAPTAPLVSVDEYLNTSYEPDMEYVDGVLIERGMPTVAHSLLQRLLMLWFARFDKQMGFMALQDVRTRIIEGARYRIPDTMLCPLPLLAGKVLTSFPWQLLKSCRLMTRSAELGIALRTTATSAFLRLF